LIEGLVALPIDTIASRNEADEQLSSAVPDPDVRQFLLKNMQRRAEGGFSWKINLPVIQEKLKNVGVDLIIEGVFEKPTLFIRGARSKYVSDADWEKIAKIFPNAKLETMETGHWVQAEKPQEFVDLVTGWIKNT
jgi:esterase